MSGGVELWEAAGVGHRVTHEDDLPEPLNLASQGIRLDHGGLLTPNGGGGSVSAKLSASLANEIAHALQLEGDPPGDCPDPCGVIERGSPNTFVGPQKRMAAIADDELDQDCNWHADGPVVQGARFVLVNGLPWARRNDELDCGARLGEGEPTVLIGGPSTPGGEPVQPSAILDPHFGAALLGGDAVPIDGSLAGKLGAAIAGGELGGPKAVGKVTGPGVGAETAGNKPFQAIKISLQP